MAARQKRNSVAQRASIDPKLLSIEGMVRACFPNAQPPAQLPAQGREEAPEAGQKKRSNVNLHSTDLWHLKGGATGDECFALVKEKTEANLAKARKTEEGKKTRAEARKEKHRASNELAATVCARRLRARPTSRSSSCQNSRRCSPTRVWTLIRLQRRLTCAGSLL